MGLYRAREGLGFGVSGVRGTGFRGSRGFRSFKSVLGNTRSAWGLRLGLLGS